MTRIYILSTICFFCFHWAFAQGIEIIRDSDSIKVCAGTELTLTASGAESYEWFPEDFIVSQSEESVVLLPTRSAYVIARAIIDDEEFRDSLWVEFIDANIEIRISGNLPSPLCEGTNMELEASVNPAGGLISWFANNRKIAEGANIQIPAPRGGFIRGIYTFENCPFTDELQIPVIEFGIPSPLFEDTTICRRSSVQLATPTGSSNTIYTWTPDTSLNNAQIPNPIANPRDTITYKLVYESRNGVCIDSFELTINVIPIDLDLNISDPVLLCLGDSIDIIATVNGDLDGLSWGPNDGALSSLSGARITAKPDYSNLYFARYEFNNCVLIDTFLIRVDSIPRMPITIIVNQADYCPGEIVVFASPQYVPLLYPDIKHEWTPQDGTLLSDPEFYNLTINTEPGERTYIRTTTNGGCIHRDTVTIIVKDPQIMISPIDTIVCPGEIVQFNIMNPVEDIQWSPSTGLSCSDCRNPRATVLNNVIYQVQGMVDGCPASTTVRVRVHNIPQVTMRVSPSEFRYVLGDRVTIFAETLPEVPENTIFNWTFNGSNVPGSADSIDVILDREVNIAIVTFITVNGCTVQAQVTIAAEPPVYRIPNAFTPNNDMVNDVFQVYREGNIEVVSIEVYNRWGQQVFKGNDNSGWDGRFNGSFCPPEVYAYKVTLRLGNGQIIQEKGDLTLLR
jgi:gliding motility-associated-like protein